MGKCQLATGNSDELDFVMDCALQLFMSLVRLCIGTSVVVLMGWNATEHFIFYGRRVPFVMMWSLSEIHSFKKPVVVQWLRILNSAL